MLTAIIGSPSSWGKRSSYIRRRLSVTKMPMSLEQAPAHLPCPPRVWILTWIPRSNPFRLDPSWFNSAIPRQALRSRPSSNKKARIQRLPIEPCRYTISSVPLLRLTPHHDPQRLTKAGWPCASPLPLLVPNFFPRIQRYHLLSAAPHLIVFFSSAANLSASDEYFPLLLCI